MHSDAPTKGKEYKKIQVMRGDMFNSNQKNLLSVQPKNNSVIKGQELKFQFTDRYAGKQSIKEVSNTREDLIPLLNYGPTVYSKT